MQPGNMQVDATHGLLPPICCLACMALAACAYNETHLAATTSTGSNNSCSENRNQKRGVFCGKTSKGTYVLRCFLRCSTTVAYFFLKNRSTDFFDQVLDVSNFLVSMVQFCCPATVWNSCMSFSLRETSVATSLGTDYGYWKPRKAGLWKLRDSKSHRKEADFPS